MSIIEETLRKMQEKQEAASPSHNNTGIPAVDGKVSKSTEQTSHKTFIMIAIVLSILGVATYIGFDKYQNKLKEKKKSIISNQDFLKTEISSIVETQKPPTTIELRNKPHKSDMLSDTETKQASVQPSQLPVLKNQFSESLENNIQKEGVNSPKATKIVESNHKIQAASFAKVQKNKLVPNETALENKPRKSKMQHDSNMEPIPESPSLENQFSESFKKDIPPQTVSTSKTTDNVKSNQKTYVAPIAEAYKIKPEPSEVTHENKQYKSDVQPGTTGATSLLVEEYVTEKQLGRAKHLVNIGSYTEAIEILKPIVDRSAVTWEAYLLMGAAHLGLGELYYAEAYLDMGLAVNGKIPQLWLQRAIVEQQRGEHEIALMLLHEAEMFAPTMPKVLLNIGYSNDALGNKELAKKAYRSFLELIEGDPTYSVVRLKVLERLANLK